MSPEPARSRSVACAAVVVLAVVAPWTSALGPADAAAVPAQSAADLASPVVVDSATTNAVLANAALSDAVPANAAVGESLASTKSAVSQTRAEPSESDRAETRLRVITIGLIVLAVVIAIATVLFWRATRPDRS